MKYCLNIDVSYATDVTLLTFEIEFEFCHIFTCNGSYFSALTLKFVLFEKVHSKDHRDNHIRYILMHLFFLFLC